MELKIPLILFAVMIFKCDGHLHILGDIISNARERVHTAVDGVAGAVLGGFNLNFGGHIGLNGQRNPPRPKVPDETIVVVVEEPNEHQHRPQNDNNANNYRPPYEDHRPPNNQRPQEPRPGYDDQYQRPHQNEYVNRPDYNNQGNGNNNFGNYDQNGRPSDQGNGNYNNNRYPEGNQFNQNNNNHPQENQENNNVYQNGDSTYNGGNVNQPTQYPSTEYFQTTEPRRPSPTPRDDVTEKPSDDLPLFVPLNPNEYVYGGDTINITAPKRDTEKTKPADADEEFPIDVRFKDE